MKKHLLAVAVAAAVAAPAMAQNVRIYGIMDASAVQTDNGPYSQTTINSGYLSSSRVGIDGNEDLGGGLKALFKLEGRLAFDGNGQVGTTNVVANGTTTTAASGFFNRDAYIGLSGGFGEINIGTMESETSRMSGVGNAAAGTNVGTPTAAFGSTFALLGDRFANSVRYISPKISGLTVTVGGFQGEYNSTTSSNVGSGYNGAQASLKFEMGPFAAAAAQASRQAAVGSAAANRNKDTVMAVSYTMGAAKFGLTRYSSDPTSATSDDRTATVFSASYALGATTLFGSYSNLEEKTGGSAFSTSSSVAGKADVLYLGAMHALSKRTVVYAVTGKLNNNNSGEFQLNTGSTLNTSSDQTNYAIGVRHSF